MPPPSPPPPAEEASAKALKEAEEKATLEQLWTEINPDLSLREKMFGADFAKKLDVCLNFFENEPLDIRD